MNERLLIVEDNPTLAEGIASIAESKGLAVRCAKSAAEAENILQVDSPDLAICDFRLPDGSGMDLLVTIRKRNPEAQVLMITAFGTIELAVEAIKKGAFDFLQKPFSMEELELKLDRMRDTLAQRRKITELVDELNYLREEIDHQYNFGELVGRTPQMKAVYQTILKVAPADTTVIIYGESGTGKELVARAIHQHSPRAQKPLVRVNCGALNENLLESELFGHEKGSFTGAFRRKKGRFELAHGGSIFLDEIGDLSLNMQLKLLRVLQEKEFERVGGEETIRVDVRVIAATNKDLNELVREGRFREDLFYRLHIVPIYLPPLRERRDDIPLLMEHFLTKISRRLGKTGLRFHPEIVRRCMDYSWPGNVRELENAIERALVLADGDEIHPDLLPFRNTSESASPSQKPAIQIRPGVWRLNETLQQVEKELICRALRLCKGNKAAAARALGLRSNTFFYKLKKYGLDNCPQTDQKEI